MDRFGDGMLLKKKTVSDKAEDKRNHIKGV